MTRSRPIPARARLTLAAIVIACIATVAGPVAHPTPAAATTATTIESMIVSLVNAERAKRGLIALKYHSGLVDLAGDRAAYMASINTLQHISCLSCTYAARGIQSYGMGEVLAWTTYPWGSEAAKSIVNGWRNSPTHWSVLMSNRSNYMGVGVAYRSSNGRTYAAGEVSESKDRTRPWARMTGGSRSGTTVSWSWTGADTLLQTHTAGFRNFDVQYRVGYGSWVTIRSGTTARSLSLSSRAHGHCYSLRVRSRDNRGYVSAFTSSIKVCVP